MANTTQNCCFKGRGNVALADWDKLLSGTAGLMPMGNAPALEISVNENVERVQDYTNPAGGSHCVVRTIEYAEVKLTLSCHTIANLVLALYGSGSAGNTQVAAVAGEPLVAWPGALVPLAAMPDVTQPILVKDATNGATTYVAGKDYTVTLGGAIQVLEGGSIPEPTIVDGVGQPNIAVDYQRAGQSLVELFTRTSLPVTLAFDGTNVVDGRSVNFQLYKVKFSAASSVALISDNISKLELTGEVMRDDARNAGTPDAPFSQFGTLKL